jgi:hypothetical protein
VKREPTGAPGTFEWCAFEGRPGQAPPGSEDPCFCVSLTEWRFRSDSADGAEGQLPEGHKHIIVMEFESEEALNKYADSPAKKRYEVYMPIREESRTHESTN